MNEQELKNWIEMKNTRRKTLEASVWISLYEETVLKEGKIFNPGYKEDVYFVRSLLLSKHHLDKVNLLKWGNLGSGNSREVYISDDGRYIPCDVYEDTYDKIEGIYPVLDQNVYHDLPSIWHLNQDIVIALKLFRDGDKWICPDEDYVEVAHLVRKENGEPQKLEIKTEFLKDYLCARDMILRLVTYRNHDTYVEIKPDFGWEEEYQCEETIDCKWEGRIFETTNNGNPFGSEAMIFHSKRVDVDKDEDIPVIGDLKEDSVEMTSKVVSIEGIKRVYRVEGEIWKNETILPGTLSTRIKGDDPQNIPFFKIDSQGTVKNAVELKNENRWIWFDPNVINTLLSKRDGQLEWYTRDTGSVSCSYGNFVHFGINEIGLITVFSEDIHYLPLWQQNIWAGFNVAPEGGVSKELLMSQVDAEPASTQAPEGFLTDEYNRLNSVFMEKFNLRLFRDQKEITDLLPKINRFQSLTEEGFYGLAKDLARITADGICTKELQRGLTIPNGIKWGSLKTLQHFFMQKVGLTEDNAKKLMAPLFGIYDLRQVDAHLGKACNDDSFIHIGIDTTLPPLFRGTEMLNSFVTVLCIMSDLVRKSIKNKKE